MPTTRKSTRNANVAKNTGKQSTLSFNNKVTKTGAAKANAKEVAASGRAVAEAKAEAKVETIIPPPSSALVKEDQKKNKELDVEEVESSDVSDEQEEEDEEEVSASSARKQLEKNVTQDKKAHQGYAEAQEISDKQVEKYWKGIQDVRIAKRVHQDSLTLSEKVLRYFDISSQYGPCTGVSRMKRWQRADRLGLHPPIEVLAVLLKEEQQGNADAEKSAIDHIMASTAIGSI
ncbi:DNA polymerase delta, subunit 4-domain-containing protein [Coniella lustricola]|uniref:DNA polymerase delta, subunit 4-domain-containing protein n=1 Tax=Coniella lustricola TaxID=2025994 RepID=A0A2T3AID9_9PEZI|nr:DNA polymerase delta, subunit 4-domain-containing protein [Coniella lustricola]